MASTFVFANNASTTLASPITSPTQTSVTLSSTANLPTIPAGDVWALTLNDAATQSVFEILYVTAISGATLTVLRGQEGTAATTWQSGDYAFASVTAGILQSFLMATNATNATILNANGTPASSTIKIVKGDATFTTSAEVAVSLSGSAQFASGDYVVAAGGNTANAYYSITSVSQTPSGFTLVSYSYPGSGAGFQLATLPNPTIVPWVAMGY